MIGEEKPIYLEYDLPDADFLKEREKQEVKDEDASEIDDISISSIQSTEIDPKLKNELKANVSIDIMQFRFTLSSSTILKLSFTNFDFPQLNHLDI